MKALNSPSKLAATTSPSKEPQATPSLSIPVAASNFKSAGRPKSASVGRPAAAKKLKSKKASVKNTYYYGKSGPENPEQADETEVANIQVAAGITEPPRAATELGEVQSSQALLQKKYTERGLEPGSKLKEETERMEKEFNDIMNDLEQKRTVKNYDWYERQLNEDYASMRKNLEGSTTGSLVRKKGQNLRDQRAEVTFKTQLAIAEMTQKGSSKEMTKN